MRKRKESETSFAAKVDESGEFQVVKKHRPSGRQRVITEGLSENEARKVRNALVGSSED